MDFIKPFTKCILQFQSFGLLFLCFLVLSCEKKDKPPFSQDEIWKCHQNSEWNEIKLKNALVGLWNWEYVALSWTPENNQYVTDQELTIEFKSDSSLIVKQHGNIIQLATWKIVGGDPDLFSLEDDPNVSQLFGRVILCNDIVEFYGSYADISDNYFRRIK